MKKGASAPASPQPNEYPNILTPNDTSITPQANHGDPEDHNTYGLCRCCDVRPVANPFDDLCPVCRAEEPGRDEFTFEVGL